MTDSLARSEAVERLGRENQALAEINARLAAEKLGLQQEIATVQPSLIVCLGATAARALLGPKFKITEGRGRFYSVATLPEILATFHPSYLLRLRDEARVTAEHQFIADLKLAAQRLRHR